MPEENAKLIDWGGRTAETVWLSKYLPVVVDKVLEPTILHETHPNPKNS